MRAHARPSHGPGVAVHALLPVDADGLHGGHARVAVATVLAIVVGALLHLEQHLGDGLLRLDVDIVPDGGPEGVDGVDNAEDEEEVEEQLGVEGQDMREVGVHFDKGEDGGDGAGLGGV